MTGTATVLAAATARLKVAFTGVVLPPRAGGAEVAVYDGPPDQINGPCAWAELASGRRIDAATATVTVRLVVVPAAQVNEAMSSSVAAAIDALEASVIPGAWGWLWQSVSIGGVDRDALMFDVPTLYPTTCT